MTPLRRTFRKWARIHPNIMTPDLLQVEQIKDKIIELSQGLGFNQESIFGVSVFDYIEEGKFTTSSNIEGKCFFNKSKAESYIANLRSQIRGARL